jgi:hyperosmotically inducible periplasmic protein
MQYVTVCGEESQEQPKPKEKRMKAIILSSLIGIGGCAIAISLTGCASTPTHESTGEAIDDSTITAKIKADYATDKDVSAMQVGVETYKGVVQLSGFVDNDYAKKRAGQLAKQVAGVKRVENNLIIKPLSGNETGLSGTNSVSEYEGEVTAMDTTNNTITVRKALISHTFQNATGLDRLGVHIGDEVKVNYQDKDGQNSVISINEVKPVGSSSQ